MPEGHSVHRITKQFQLHFVGHEIAVTSPQGRFAIGAAEIDGRTMTAARASGKQMFLEFGDRWLRIHLGMYGAWDFAGVEHGAAPRRGSAAQNESSLSSIGAPRLTRLRISESERVGPELDHFPPEPIGQVRVRLLTDKAVADLRGPTACTLMTQYEVDVLLAALGPDPQNDHGPESEERFIAAVRKKPTPIGQILMDQSVVGGIGNVYRAELLFRAQLNPHTSGKLVPVETLRLLWRDWALLLADGVATGQMMTMDNLDDEAKAKALANRDDRHWVYHRAGLPCRVCGNPVVMEIAAGRKLYYCGFCQR
jgi:endonuclease VIII